METRITTYLQRLVLLAAAASITVAAGAQELSPQNQRNKADIEGLTVFNVAGLASGLLAPPPADKLGEVAEYTSNLGLKYVPGVMQLPPDVVLEPNTTCGYNYLRSAHPPGTIVNYDNIFGIELGQPSDWGIFDDAGPGTDDDAGPEIYHYNTGAWLTLRRNHVDLAGNVERDFRDNPVRTILFTDTDDRRAVERGEVGENGVELFAIGTHSIEWELENKLDVVFDVLLDPVIFFAEMKWAAKSKAAANKQKRFGRVWDDAAIKWAKTLEGDFGFSLGTEIAIKLATLGLDVGVDQIDDQNLTSVPTGVINRGTQSLRVLDRVPPQVSMARQPAPFEATTLGGEFGRRHFDEIRELVMATDACDRPVVIEPEPIGTRFWPTGVTTTLQWCARDLGPTSAQGGFNRSCTDVFIEVQDTLPPLLLPPNSLSVIANSSQSLNIGAAGVFDLADPDVSVTNDAPTTFPVGRTQVTWTATDSSGNSVQKSQWVSVKESNTVPVARSQSGLEAVSFEPLRIELAADDPDLLDGRYDQLAFRIQDPPDNGFFVAPLFPFFIEDHRTHRINPDGTYSSWRTERQAECENSNIDPPLDKMIDPFYIDVLDDGTVYTLDWWFTCTGGGPDFNSKERISKWVPDADGALQFAAQFDLDNLATVPETFEIDSRGRIWLISAGSSVINVLDADLVQIDRIEFDWFTEINPSTGNRQVAFNRTDKAIRSILVDDNDVAYVTDGRQLLAYDLQQLIDSDPNYGGLYYKPVYTLATSAGVDTTVEPYRSYVDLGRGGYADMELDSAGNIYVSDEPTNRIWKFQATKFGADRDTLEQAPEFVGWLGRCVSNLDPTVLACDVDLQRSIGYSCQDDLCGTEPQGAAGQGQFARNRGIAMAPNDVLYVTDTDNFRVQRFTPDGFFAGEAVSECRGSCFVLGDFGRVDDVTVNSNFFYLLDPDQQVTHIFQTTPITDIDDQSLQQTQSAFVTYQSNNNYRGPDSFSFVALDGLEESAPGVMQINVRRNFRAPVATAGIALETDEDVALEFELTGLDADEDQLRFIISDDPAHGTITESNGLFTYTPDADFYGEDRFEFVASDSPTSVPAMESAPEEVTVTVLPVNDLPVINVEAQAVAGAYYPYVLEFTVEDADPDDRQRIAIHWGDGTIMDSTSEDIVVGGSDGIARVFATHTIRQDAPANLAHTICVSDTDNTRQLNCGSVDVTARATFSTRLENMVDMIIDIGDSLPKYQDPNVPDQQLSEPALDGVDEVTYTVNVLNNPPGNETEPDATNVVLEIQVPAEMDYLRSAASKGSCSRSGKRLSCALGTMQAFEEAAISVTMIGNGQNLADEIATVHAEIRATEPDPGQEDNVASLQTDLLFNPDLDPDGDGVANRDDAFPGDPTEWVDTDLDGIGNNADPDDDGDLMSDTWERRFGLDPLDPADGAGDLDGDGLSNADEFLADSRPDVGDSDLDGLADGVDNCAGVLNFNQFDLDGDTVGDSCDADHFVGGAWIGDLDGNGASDFALVRIVGSAINAFLKDSDTDFSVGANRVALGDTALLVARRLFANAGSSGNPAPGLVATDATGATHLAVFNTGSGASAFQATLFDPGWDVVDVVPGAATIYAAAANRATGETAVERRSAADGALLATFSYGNGLMPVAVSEAAGGDALALLASDAGTGDVEVLLADATDGTETGRWTVGGADIVIAHLAGYAGGAAVVTQDTSGAAVVGLFESGNANPRISFAPFADGRIVTGIAHVPALDAIAVSTASAADGTGISTFALADGALLNEFALQDGSVSPRATVIASPGNGAELGSVVADANGDVTMTVIDASDGSNVRTLRAESASPPPPPAPPPPPPPSGDGGGGGGSAGWLFTVLLGIAAGLRRRRRC